MDKSKKAGSACQEKWPESLNPQTGRAFPGELRVQIPPDDRGRRARTPEPSFQALTKAVSYLSNLDDFVQESLGSGFFSDVFKVMQHRNDQNKIRNALCSIFTLNSVVGDSQGNRSGAGLEDE